MLNILKTLHSAGIVHRDFTPDNLILRPDGMLKLIDFNVAQDESEGTTATIVGKHAYVPPEQFRGKPTTQSDLYALGATLFYLHTAEEPEPITQSTLPEHLKFDNESLSRFIEACTAIETDERVKSVDELIENFKLNELPVNESVSAVPPAAALLADEVKVDSISTLQTDSDVPIESENAENGQIITLDATSEKQCAS